MPKVYLKTYGCQMNERDSEQVARMFTEGGYTVTSNEKEADVILINTCSVRDQAEQKALGKMGSMMHHSRHRAHVVYGFMGCMAQSRGDAAVQGGAQSGCGRRHPEIPQGVRLRGHHPAAAAGSPHGRAVPRAARRQRLRHRGGGRLAKHHPRSPPETPRRRGLCLDHAGLQHALLVLHRARHPRQGTRPPDL